MVGPVDFHDFGIRHGGGRSDLRGLTREAAFAEEVAFGQHADNAVFALLRDDADLHPALLDVIDRVRFVALAEDFLALGVLDVGAAGADLVEKRQGIP